MGLDQRQMVCKSFCHRIKQRWDDSVKEELAGAGEAPLPDALERKYRNAGREWDEQ